MYDNVSSEANFMCVPGSTEKYSEISNWKGTGQTKQTYSRIQYGEKRT